MEVNKYAFSRKIKTRPSLSKAVFPLLTVIALILSVCSHKHKDHNKNQKSDLIKGITIDLSTHDIRQEVEENK